jgi:ribonuclease HI
VNWQKNGWKNAQKKPVENQDLWKDLLPFLDQHEIEVVRVKGHVNLNSENTNVMKLYEKFCDWNGGGFSLDEFRYIIEKNNRADELANKGIDELR